MTSVGHHWGHAAAVLCLLPGTHYNQALKSKENFECSKREKAHYIQRNPDKAISRFLSRNLAGHEKVLEVKYCPMRILYPGKLFFRNERDIKTLPDKTTILK